MIRRKSARVDGSGKLEIRRVIGLTASNGNGLASCPTTEDVAYAAGCVVVIYNAASDDQTSFLTSPKANKAISSLAYSTSGKFLAAGEAGHQPAVLVWDTGSKACIAELKLHRYGIACLSFSPGGKHLVSVGAPHDGQICIWDWKNGVLLAKVRAAAALAPISTLAYAADGAFFATGGVKHVKCWSVGGLTNQRLKSAPGGVLESRPVALGAQKEADFVSLAVGPCLAAPGVKTVEENGTIYGVTALGILCLIRGGKALERWVDLKVHAAYALKVCKAYCACACARGVVRLFAINTLTYAATLPKPMALKYQTLGAAQTTPEVFPDAVGCSFIGDQSKLAVLYSDHSLSIWDLTDLSRIALQRCFQGHGACIWDVASLPQNVPAGNGEQPPGVATCSADGSIRLWNVEERKGDVRNQKTGLVPGCQELLGAFHLESPAPSLPSFSTSDDTLRISGFRSLAVRPDGRHLAAGDRGGNLRVYELGSGKLVSFQEAHDSEILTLSYSESGPEGGERGCLLASGGRDRLIHLYDVSRNYDVVETLDDHSASITAVRFASHGSKLLSCSADKSVVFRNLFPGPSGDIKSSRYHQEVASRGTLYDLDVDPGNKLVVTAGQEKRLTLYSLTTGKPVRSFRPESDAGEPIKVKMDPGGATLLCSHSDKCVRIFDSQSGELLAKGSGHSEVITGLVLTPTCNQLISVSGDSCIFVWQLPADVSRAIRRKTAAFARPSAPPLPPSLMPLPPALMPPPPGTRAVAEAVPQQRAEIDASLVGKASFSFPVPQSVAQEMEPATPPAPKGPPGEKTELIHEEDPGSIDFKMSVSKLPSWAQPKGAGAAGAKGASRPAFVVGESKWAERIGREGYKLFSDGNEDGSGPGEATVRASGFGRINKFTPEKSTGPALLEHPNGVVKGSTPAGEARRHSSDDVGGAMSPGRGVRRASEGNGGVLSPVASPQVENSKSNGDDQERGAMVDDVAEADGYSSDSDFEGEQSPGEQKDEGIGKEDSDSEKIKRVDKITSTKPAVQLDEQGNGPQEEGTAKSDVGGVNTAEGTLGWDDDDDVELGEEMEDSPRLDLFAAHFDSLQKQTPVDTNRQSLSARFFARHSLSLSHSISPLPLALPLSSPPPHASPLEHPESPTESIPLDISTPDGNSLAVERERLKQKDRQSRMAAEVARLRERMSGLGIAILPRASSGTLDTAAFKSQLGDDSPTETSSREKDAESGVASPARPLAGPWLVSDRAGKVVPPPVPFEDALGGQEGVNGPQALSEEANTTDVGALEMPVREAGKVEGGVSTPPQKVQPQSTKMERTDSVEGAQTEGVQTPPLFAHRTSPWASHTNPLFDVDHSKSDSPPFPVTSLGPRFANGAPASTVVSTLLVAAHQAPRTAASEESEALVDEPSGSESSQSEKPEEKSHVSDEEARHVFPRRGFPTPPAERSQSPDLDHERAQKSDCPIEPLILDHTKRNAAQRNDARFDSPSLSEGIPTSPPSDISFPRLLQQENPPTSPILPTLDFPAAEASDSDDEAEVLQPVALLVDGERMFRMPSRDATMPENEDKWGGTVVLSKEVEAEAALKSECDAGLRKAEDNTETGDGREAGSSENMTGAISKPYSEGCGENAAKNLESGVTSPVGTLPVPQQDFCLGDSGSVSADVNIPFKEQENDVGAVSTEKHRLESAANGCHNSERPSESPEPSVASSAGQTTHAPIYPEAPGLGLHTAEHVPGRFLPGTSRLPPLPITESVELPRPTEEYQSALRALVDAADRASLLFEELKAYKAHSVSVQSSGGDGRPQPATRGSLDVSALTQSYQEFVPSAVQKLQRMMQNPASSPGETAQSNAQLESEMPPMNRGSEVGTGGREHFSPKESSEETKRGTKKEVVNASVDSMLASVDMEAVLERYSSRYSEMLAKQLLALMGRSLQGDTLT